MKKYAYFLGCITPLRYPNIEASTKIVMRELGIQLLEMNGASCCPAPGVFGSFDLFNWLILAARNLAIAENMGVDITVTCNGCYGTLQEAAYILRNPNKRSTINETLAKEGLSYEGNVEVKHITEVILDDIGLEKIKSLIKVPLNGLKVAVHYGCHYLKPRKIRGHGSAERPTFLDELVEALGGEAVDYKDKMMCCGAGGGVRSAFSDLALRYTLDKIRNIQAAEGDCVLNPCAFCHFQLDTGQKELMESKRLEKPVPVVFVTQLLGLSLGIPVEKLGLQYNKVPPYYLEKIGLKIA